MSRSNDKGRPAPQRRPASFRSRLVAWVERVVPWFAVVVTFLVAVWLAFPLYWAVESLLRATERMSAHWADVAVYGGALVGVVFLGLTAVRAVSPSQTWPPDGRVRVFVTLGLVLTAFTIPLLVLRGQLIPVVALVIYYVRVRRALVEIVPPWAGGTWKPDKSRRRAQGDVVKRPPRSWDETSGVGSSRSGEGAGQAAGRSRRKQSKKKRRPGR